MIPRIQYNLKQSIYTVLLQRHELMLIVVMLALMSVGLVSQYAISQADGEDWFSKQLSIIGVLTVAMFVISRFSFSFIYRNAYIVYALGIVLLLVANIVGYKAMGAQRWIRLGFINFQPSEFMKVFLIIALAKFYHDASAEGSKSASGHWIPLMLILLPFLLILKQPNLGTASIILMLGVMLIFVAGLNIKYFVAVGLLGLISIPIVWEFLHDYQKRRVLTFLDPEIDPLGAGYNIIQSMIAIGSGGLGGKGFMEGTQSQLSFLPEKHTDFIFAVFAEEFGFIGVSIVFALTVLLMVFSYRIALSSNNQFGRIIILGVVLSFFLHVIINTAMIAGLIPVVGIPFPLLSYGGSNLAGFMIGFGLLLNKNLVYNKR